MVYGPSDFWTAGRMLPDAGGGSLPDDVLRGPATDSARGMTLDVLLVCRVSLIDGPGTDSACVVLVSLIHSACQMSYLLRICCFSDGWTCDGLCLWNDTR